MYRVFPRSTKRCHLCKITFLWHVLFFLKTFDFWLHFIFQFWNWCCQHGISCYNIVFLRCLLFWDLLFFLLFIIFLGQKSLYYLHYCIDYIWYFNRRSNYTLMNFYLEKMKVIHLGTFLIRSENTNLKTSVINQVKNHLAMKFVLKKREKWRRSNKSKAFHETLTKAKSSMFSCTNDMVVRNWMIWIKLNSSTGTTWKFQKIHRATEAIFLICVR